MANEQPDKAMQEQFEQLRQAISKDVADQLALQLGAAKSELKADLAAELKANLTEQLDSAKADLKQFAQVRFEELKDHVKMAAKELSTKWDTNIEDHGLILKNHAARLEKLEQR